jgi:heptosyltransferase-2
MRSLLKNQPRRILVRGTNWVGDAVMTLPALKALAAARPQARIEVLAKPWVRAVYEASPAVDEVVEYDSGGRHAGFGGLRRLAQELRGRDYDWALLLQNAFEAAVLARMAGIPSRLGYASDGRRMLLSHAVPLNPAIKRAHQTSYYLNLLHGLGLLPAPPPPEGVRPNLSIDQRDRDWAEGFLAGRELAGKALLGLAPGASFGPAKCWPCARFVAAAVELLGGTAQGVLLFGSSKEASVTGQVAAGLASHVHADLAGRTTLGQALALLQRLSLFITNDSGLMHAAAAMGVPTVAVFGSTNPATTAPLGPSVALVRHAVDCSPCLKPECPRDLRCFSAISPEEVALVARELLTRTGGAGEGLA